jgi:peptidyl-prolyl cis-trans isomerase C
MADRRFSAVAWLTVALAALAISVTGCGPNIGPETPPEAGDTAVAKVNGHSVWASEVKREAIAQGLIGEGEPLDMQSDLFRRVLDEVIDRRLLVEEALKRRLDKDPTVQRRLQAARDRMLGDALLDEMVSKAINENTIRSLYQEQVKLSKQTDEFRLRQIVTPTQAEADMVKKLLLGGASFDALAVQRSTDAATRFSGGDMGYITSDVMPAAYAPAVKDAKVGDLVGPVRVDGGFAIIKVEDRRQEAPLSLEAARPQIIRFLTYDQIRSVLADLRGKAKIERLLPKAQDVPGAPREPASAPPASSLSGAAADRALAGAAPGDAAPASAPLGPMPISPTPDSGLPQKPRATPAPAPAAGAPLRK